MDLEEIAKVILGESELDLREALQSGVANANDHIQNRSLLELAVGWPEGVRILLEFGADASTVNLNDCSYRPQEADDSDFPTYGDPITPLLQGGCIFRSCSITQCKSEKVRSLLIDEYVKRRRKLHTFAQACLMPGAFVEIPTLGSSESILDVDTFRVFTELIKNGWPVDSTLANSLEKDRPVYHESICDLNPWDGLYRAGFQDIDVPDSRGLTPLMVCCLKYHSFNEKAAIWLVDKGATLSRRLPFSKATIAHMLSSRVATKLKKAIFHDNFNTRRLHQLKETINERKKTIFLIPSMQDSCILCML